MDEYKKEFAELFRGYTEAYGVFQIEDGQTEGKQKGKAITVRGQVGEPHWDAHFHGRTGLGIVPLLADNHLCFGAIDIDDYTLSLSDLNDKIHSQNLPLIPFRSKSGGAHLFMFLEEPVPAKLARQAMETMSNLLGFHGVEIFPKQDMRPDPNSVGNWLNMPYFFAESTDRYGIDQDGNAIPFQEIVGYVKSHRTSAKALQHYTTEEKTRTEKKEPLAGGPPCLNTLLIRGFPPNTRNNTLFNLGVYAKKAFPDDWEETIENYNRDLIDPPLDHREVGAVVKSLSVKDYNYKCKDNPIVSVCNKSKCLVCKFGVRPDEEIPKLGKLTKVMTDPPVWRIDVIDGGIIELSTEELQTPRQFQKRCMEELSVMPPVVKGDQWREIISGLLENLEIIEVPKEASPKGRMLDHLSDFLTGRVQAKKREEILSGKPWLNDSRHYFRMKDFLLYLDRVKFTEVKQNKVLAYIKEIEAVDHTFFNIKGTGTNVWSVPQRQQPKE